MSISPKIRAWAWIIVAGALLVAWLGLSASVWFSGKSLYQNALGQGQRVEFSLKTQEVDGKLLTREELATRSSTPESPTATDETAKAETQPEETQETATHEEASAQDSTSTHEPVEDTTPTASHDEAHTEMVAAPPSHEEPSPVAAPVAGNQGASIAIVISGLGLGSIATEAALALPPAVTLSFSPYSRNLDDWLARSSKAGHMLMLDLPLQTSRYPAIDPGPFGLLLGLSPDMNGARLESILTKAAHVQGVLAPPQEVVLAESAHAEALKAQLKKHHFSLLYASDPLPPTLSGDVGIPVLTSHTLLDQRITEDHIRQQLTTLEDEARRRGFAVGVGKSYPVTVELVSQWATTLEKRGFTLVALPASGKQ